MRHHKKHRNDDMIRKQVSLDEVEYKLAKKEARALGQALPSVAGAPWMRYAGFVESGDPRSSHSVDDIVYGAKD
jgi:hypothetical protein